MAEAGPFMARVHLDTGEALRVRNTVEEISDRVRAAHSNNNPSIELDGFRGKQGLLLSRIVRWEGVRT